MNKLLSKEIFIKLSILSSKINSVENLSSLLNLIINSAKELLECESTSLLLVDEKSSLLRFHVVSGDENEINKYIDQSFPLGAGIAGTVAQTGIPVISNDVHKDGRFYQEIDAKSSFVTKNLLCVPMKVRQKITGVLEAINANKGFFTQDDQDLLSFLANETAIAIHNRLLFSRLEKANQDLNSRAKELKYLYELSLQTREQHDIHDILNSAICGVSKLLKATKVSLFLFDSTNEYLKIFSAIGHDEEFLKLQKIPIYAGIMGHIISNKKPLLVTDINNESKFPFDRRKSYFSNSFLSVPIIVEGSPAGILNMTDKINYETFNSFDLQVVTSVASFIAKNYENYLLKNAVSEQNRIKKEIEIASTLQNSFLPKIIPYLKGLDIAVYKPTLTEIGGDFYDFIQIDESKLVMAICHVSGKGVAAALAVALFKNMLRGQVKQNASPKLVLNWINQQFYKDATAEMSIQAIYIVIDTHNKVITYSASGNELHFALFSHNNKEVIKLKKQDQPLGDLSSFEYFEYMYKYEFGDILLACTIDNSKNNFNLNNLENIIWEFAEHKSEKIVNTLKNECTKHFPKDQCPLRSLLMLKSD
ncbi:MAG: GAF domain-containing protein [Spirochaetota bacterium]|nr:GAF domain-containing protein [Spirochaetota bacterium]